MTLKNNKEMEVIIIDCNDCIFQQLIDREICGHPEMAQEDQYLEHKSWDDKRLKHSESCPLRKQSITFRLKNDT